MNKNAEFNISFFCYIINLSQILKGELCIATKFTNSNQQLASLETKENAGSQFTVSSASSDSVKINLPDKIDVVVGDTLELFYHGMIQAVNPFNYDIDLSEIPKERGSRYKNRWIYTPAADHTDFSFTIKVSDNAGNLLDKKNVTVKVHPVKQNPTTVKNILCLGDSLTGGGQWVGELRRRLCSTDAPFAGDPDNKKPAAPGGHGYTNIQFIGTQGTAPVKYEGYGGWTWGHYTSPPSNIEKSNVWITVKSGLKTDAASDQSIWKDNKNQQWQLETRDTINNKIKFKHYPADSSYLMPDSGTLTYVSGGGDQANIIYNGTTPEKGNPFWNYGTNCLSFRDYCTKNGFDNIDFAYILLGYNSIRLTGSEIVIEGKKLVDKLHEEYPNCKITIVGVMAPSEDAMGSYGTGWNYYTILKKAFEFNTAYLAWTYEPEYSSFMDFTHLSSQFDSYTNVPTATRPLNIRTYKTEIYATGLHPTMEGYMQIADAIYRNFMGKL